jgi:DNA-binding LacI/PurR family transcriptional regulator
MRDIADQLGVSRQLVSLVLRGSPGPSAQSRERILAAADRMGYRPNASARLLRQRRTHLLGALFALRNPFEVRFIEQLEARAADQGYALVLGARSPERADDVVIEQLLTQRVEALIAFNPDGSSPAMHDALERIPVAWMGERADPARVDNIRVDEDKGLRLAVEHLVALGHQRIAYVGGDGGAAGRLRADAYRQAMQHAGLGQFSEVLPADFSEESGAHAAREWAVRPASDRPTALLCCGDLNAVGVLATLSLLGVHVPGEVSVVGFDDSYVAALSYHRLTSIRQDVDETVSAALSTVLARIEDPVRAPREVLTTTTLTVRASTGPAAR